MSDDFTSQITDERLLRCGAEHAFATYTGRIGEWPGEGQRKAGTGCTVRFAHGGWTDANASVRKKFGDWPVILDRVAALADSVARSERPSL